MWGRYLDTDLYIRPRGTINTFIYRDDILQIIVRSSAGAIVDSFVLQDNAWPHRARLVPGYFREETILCMDWLALSQDLYPIEHIWDALRKRVSAMNPLLDNFQSLRTVFEQRPSLPTALRNAIILSMEHCSRAWISVWGDHTNFCSTSIIGSNTVFFSMFAFLCFRDVIHIFFYVPNRWRTVLLLDILNFITWLWMDF